MPETPQLASDGDAVRDLADRHQMRYGGSLPWCPDVADLADSDEVGQLVAAVVPVLNPDQQTIGAN